MATGDQRLQQRPFLIFQIASLGTHIHGTGCQIMKLPASVSAA
jgi:hypothetical protein